MAVNPRLMARLRKALRVGDRRLYYMISAEVNRSHVSREVAALAIASRAGIPISQFADREQMAELRAAARPSASDQSTPRQPVVHMTAPAVSPARNRSRGPSRKEFGRRARARSKEIWVVEGRDSHANTQLHAFLRAIDLKPVDFLQALSRTKKGAPFVGEVIDVGLNSVGAIVVLLTPDDEGRLLPRLQKRHDPLHERQLTPQARPNVIFEAGMAFGRHQERTVIVQLGQVRPFSDIAGRHVVHLDNSVGKRQELATKLKAAGADVDLTGTDWHSAGDFGDGDWP